MLVSLTAIPFLPLQVNFKSTEQSEKTSKLNIAGLHKWPSCLVDELKISTYFIGEIVKYASFGGGNSALQWAPTENIKQWLNSLVRDRGFSSAR